LFRWTSDRLLLAWLRGAAVLCGAILLLVAVFVVREAVEALRAVGPLRFATDPSWHPAPAAGDGLYNLTPMLSATLAATLGAVLLAGPIGVASAIFCQFYAPGAIAKLQRRIVGLLAGIPSVVYGFWGLVVLVPWIRALAPPGPSLIAGILILAIMIVPTVALIAESSLAAVPRAYVLGANALGLSRVGVIFGVVLPAARSGLSTSVILGAGRAIGETMAILMVCGNVVAVPESLFSPVRTLTANIALEMAYAMGDHRSALFVSGVVLLAMIVGLVVLTNRLGGEPARA